MSDKIKFNVHDKKTGSQTDSYQVFLNDESDGGSASLGTTLSAIQDKYVLDPRHPVLKTPIPFHNDECCGCCHFYFSVKHQEIVVECNECGEKRKALFNDTETLSIRGWTVPIDCDV